MPFVLYTDHKILKYLFDQPLLNNHHRRWLELLKDHYVSIQYHPGKANIVVNALSRQYITTLIGANMIEWRPLEMYVLADI